MSKSINSVNSKKESMNLQNNESAASRTGSANSNKKTFSCTQNQLYILCYLAWENFLQNITAFQQFRAVYTPQFAKDRIAEIDAAKGMKNERQRNLQTSDARFSLVTATNIFSESWVNLKEYIIATFEGPELEFNLIAAGSPYYSKASIGDWEALASLMKDATDYINLKKDELMKNDNMPGSFLNVFLEKAVNCNRLLQSYKQLALNKKRQTTGKADANNAIYNVMKSMLANGQVIFKKSAIKDDFTFAKLYEIIKSQSPASICGYMLGPDGKGLAGVTVTVQNTEQVVVTNKKGYYSFNRLAGDKSYMIVATLENYVTHYEGVILKAGTAKHLNLQLQPVVASTQSIEKHMQTAEAV